MPPLDMELGRKDVVVFSCHVEEQKSLIELMNEEEKFEYRTRKNNKKKKKKGEI